MRFLLNPSGPVRMAQACAITVGGAGVLCLLGYAFDVRSLASAAPDAPAMAPATALMLTVAGISVWLLAPGRGQPGPAHRRRRLRVRYGLGRLAGAVVALFGVVVLAEYLVGLDAGIETVLFPDTAAAWRAGAVKGRPSPSTGLVFLVVGLTLVLLDADARRGYLPARLLAPAAAFIAVVVFLASIYGLTDPGGRTTLVGMVPHTGAACLVLCAGILACRPDRPAMRPFTSDGPGGTAVRRLLPAMLLGIAALAAFLAAVGVTGLLVRGLRVTVAMTALLVLAYLALLYTGSALDRAGHRHQQLVGDLREREDFSETVLRTLDDGVAAIDADGVVLRVTARWSEIMGYPAEMAVGCRPPYPWWPPEQTAERTASLCGMVRTPARRELATKIVRADGTRLDILVATSPIRGADGRVKGVICTVRDLTERNRAEAERRQLTDQLDHLFAMSHDLMCIAGTDGYLKRVNPTWERMFGHPTEEFLGRPYIDFVHPEDVPRSTGLADAMAGRRITSVVQETRIRHRDGSYRWINWNVTVAPEDDAVYAVGRDVTEQQEAGEAKARLAAIVNSTDEAIIGKALDGTITSWNPAAERIYGYRADEVVGRSIHILLPPEQYAGHDQLIAHAARGEAVREHDTVRVRKDGKQIHVELSVTPVRDSAGNVVGEASVSREITTRRRADERFRRLVVNAPIAMVMVDAVGAIKLVNKETERLFGYAEKDLIGRPVELLVPHQLRDGHAAQRHEYLTGPVVRSMGAGQDLYGQRRDGTQFPVEIGLAPLDSEEGVLVSAVIHDITERKQIQHALAAARDDAVAAARLRSQFVAMVSHEIRTPMNGVIGLANLLLDTDLSTVQRRYVDAVQTSARALLTIINDILDFSKIEAGKATLAEADFDLGDLVEEVVNVAAEASRDKHLEVIGSYPANTPTAVHGDEGRIRQVLLNLIGNAVKFTEAGEVVLRVEPAPAMTNWYTFSVTDTGMGIATADIARLFEAFTQADTTTSRQYGGTGLGLTISRQLVELMGGRLDVESQAGQGSRFFFTIPLAPRDSPSGARPVGHSPLPGRRLLIVDDNATCRDMLADHATSWGMSTTTVASGEAALARLLDPTDPERPDIAVVDQHMSGIDGLELAEQIIANPAINAPTIVLMATGYHGDERLAARAGSLYVLPKPVGPSAFYNCLVQILHPEAAKAAEEHAPPTADRAVDHHGPVLLAEDNDINQMVAIDTLAMLGYSADVARNGIEAVQLATTKRYAAILMDCQMPRMDGFEATRELRRLEPPEHHTPIIALTAGALTEDRQRCLDAGMDDYITKPIDPDDLRAALERWTATAP
jgi:PAS domain S-box-containing protein